MQDYRTGRNFLCFILLSIFIPTISFWLETQKQLFHLSIVGKTRVGNVPVQMNTGSKLFNITRSRGAFDLLDAWPPLRDLNSHRKTTFSPSLYFHTSDVIPIYTFTFAKANCNDSLSHSFHINTHIHI